MQVPAAYIFSYQGKVNQIYCLNCSIDGPDEASGMRRKLRFPRSWGRANRLSARSVGGNGKTPPKLFFSSFY